MPRLYKRKDGAKPRSPINSDTVKDAVKMVLDGGTFKGTARRYNISVMTLKRYLKKYNSKEDETFDHSIRQRRIFTDEEEQLLTQNLETVMKSSDGFTQTQLRKIAFEFSVKNNVKIPDAWKEKGCAGYDWCRGFLNRHPKLMLGTLKPSSCVMNSNQREIRQFFDTLQILYNCERLEPQNIWNIDERDLTTVYEPTNTASMPGINVTPERGELVTVCAGINAAGHHIPPFMIFPRVEWQDRLLEGAPPGTSGCAFPSGLMTADNFVKFLGHFKNHVKCSPDNKVLIIMDNHDTHITVESLNYAKDNGMIMLTTPSDISYVLQPLDAAIFVPLRKHFSIAAQDWISNHPGRTISLYDIGELLGMAFPSAVLAGNIINSFRTSGIWPLNRNIFSSQSMQLMGL